MQFEGNTEIFVNMGCHDNVLPHWYEAQFHRDLAHSESRNLSELIRHPSKGETAFHWSIATRDFVAMSQVVSDLLSAELDDMFKDNPHAVLNALFEHIRESMG